MIPLPDDLYQASFNLGAYAIPLRGTPQVDAKLALHKSLAVNDVQTVLEALRDFARAFRRDRNGRHIPERLNGTVRRAHMLIFELEQLVGSVRRAA